MPKSRPRYRPTDRRLAWVSGTIFGRDEVPEVNRINASSVAGRQLGIDAAHAFAGPTRLNAPGPSLGCGDQIDDGYAEGMSDASACRIHVRARQQRRYPQIAEITLPFVSGEARVERHTDRTGCDRDHRHRSLWSVRQYHRYAVTSADTEAAQPANRIVRPGPERAICHRGRARAPGWPRGRALFAHSRQEDLGGTKKGGFRPDCLLVRVAVA